MKDMTLSSDHDNTLPVIVIGAGMAGLAAARHLAKEGQNVLVLEARDRVGGRVCTRIVAQGTPALDIGAAWIHGVEGNPITALCQRFDVETKPFGSDLLLYGLSGTTLNFNVDGHPLTQSELLQRHEAFTALYRHLESSMPDYVQGASLEEWLEHLMQKAHVDSALQPLLRSVLARVTEDDFGANIRDLAGWALNEGKRFDGEDEVPKGGYGRLARRLSHGLNIRYGEVVQQVRQHARHLSVITENGEFQAAAVIVTVPLGVLKAGSIVFSPPLPDEKQAAIERIGMGQYGKLFLYFDTCFWPEDIEILCHEASPKGHWNAWYAMNHLQAGPILCALFGGDIARTLEAMPPEHVVEEALASLQALFDHTLPALKSYHLTRWGQDRFSMGAYSYPHKKMHPDDRTHLAAPVNNRLFFAGEATSRHYSATAHGAYLSGVAAAKAWLGSISK